MTKDLAKQRRNRTAADTRRLRRCFNIWGDRVEDFVLIEASLDEVSLTDDLRYGLPWSFQGGDGPVVLSEASNGGSSQRFPGFSYLFTGRNDIRAVLNTIETVTDVNVISSPKLLVLNNRQAEL